MELTQQFLVRLLRFTTQIRAYMMDNLTEAELAFRVPGNPTLGELCREMGNVESSYLDSFKTRKLIWDRQRDGSPATAASVQTLRAWYKALDEEFESVLLAIPESDFRSMMIERSGRSTPADWHCYNYHEALLIFYGRSGVYFRMMGKPLNEQWIDWIG